MFLHVITSDHSKFVPASNLFIYSLNLQTMLSNTTISCMVGIPTDESTQNRSELWHRSPGTFSPPCRNSGAEWSKTDSSHLKTPRSVPCCNMFCHLVATYSQLVKTCPNTTTFCKPFWKNVGGQRLSTCCQILFPTFHAHTHPVCAIMCYM